MVGGEGEGEVGSASFLKKRGLQLFFSLSFFFFFASSFLFEKKDTKKTQPTKVGVFFFGGDGCFVVFSLSLVEGGCSFFLDTKMGVSIEGATGFYGLFQNLSTNVSLVTMDVSRCVPEKYILPILKQKDQRNKTHPLGISYFEKKPLFLTWQSFT